MADCISLGISLNCTDDFTPGVGLIYGVDRDDVDTFDIESTGEISAIVMVVGKTFKRFEFENERANFKETGVDSGGRIVGYDALLNFVIKAQSQSIRNGIEELQSCTCGTVWLFQDKDDAWRILGLGDVKVAKLAGPFPETLNAADEPSKYNMKEQEGDTGDALDSEKIETVGVGGRMKVKARYFTGLTAGLF